MAERSKASATIVIAAVVAGWSTVLPLVGFTLLRVIRLDDRVALLFAAETLTPWLYLPAYVVLVCTLVRRGRALAVVSGVLVIAHLVWVAPDMRWWAMTQPAASAERFNIVAANVQRTNATTQDAALTLGRLQADILVVTELTPTMQRALVSNGTLEPFPYRVENPVDGFFGSAIYSRFPMSNGAVFDLEGFPAVRAEIDVPGGTTTVVAVHTLQPLSGLAVLRRQLGDLDALARRAGIDGPVILAGDFNTTRQHRPFRSLLSRGLRDAHMQRGRGRARSWPVGRREPPFALLDHVLVSRRVAVEDAGIETVPGSDHRAVSARLAIAPAGSNR